MEGRDVASQRTAPTCIKNFFCPTNISKEANDEDLILISDVDEIPNLSKIDLKKINQKIILFKQDMFYYKFNLKLPNTEWIGTKACKKKHLISPQWLRNIKDRKYRGQTVPLGNGDTDFELFFNLLQKINYDGELIIQGARECGINPEETCTKYLQFVKKFVDKY